MATEVTITPIDLLADPEILALSNLQMDPDQDTRLSELLEKQRERSFLSNEPNALLSG